MTTFSNLLCEYQDISPFRSSALSQLELTAFSKRTLHNHDQLRYCGRRKIAQSSRLRTIADDQQPSGEPVPAAEDGKMVLLLFADGLMVLF